MSRAHIFGVWLGLYVLGLIVGVYLARRRQRRSIDDFYNAADSPVGLFVLVLTFVATLASAFFMVGIPGFVYTHGIGAWPYIITGNVLGVLGLYYVGRRLLVRRDAFIRAHGRPPRSPLQLITASRGYASFFVVAVSLLVLPYLTIQLSGVGTLVESATGGAIDAPWGRAALLAVILYYSFATGIRGIAYSDVFHGLLFFGTSWVVAAVLVYGEADGPHAVIMRALELAPATMATPGPQGLLTTGALISSCIIFASNPIAQPQFLTRYLLITSERRLRSLAISMALILSIATIPVLFIGLYGIGEHPGLTRGDALLGTALSASFGDGFSGLVWVAVLAAAMSTADSVLFSLGQLFATDVYRPARSGAVGADRSLLVAKLFVGAVALAAFALSFVSGTLIVDLARVSFAGTLQLAPSVVGLLFCREARPRAGIFSALAGLVTWLGLHLAPLKGLPLDPAIFGLLAGTLCFAAFAARRRVGAASAAP